MDLSDQHGVDDGRAAAERHMQWIEPQLFLDQLHAQMAARAGADRTVSEFVAAGADLFDVVVRRTRNSGFGGHPDQRCRTDESNWRQIFQRFVREFGVEKFGAGQRAVADDADGVAIVRLGRGVGAKVATRTGLVLHDDRLAQGLGQRLGQQSRQGVGRRAAGEAIEEARLLRSEVKGKSRFYLARERLDISLGSRVLCTVVVDYVPAKLRSKLAKVKAALESGTDDPEAFAAVEIIPGAGFVWDDTAKVLRGTVAASELPEDADPRSLGELGQVVAERARRRLLAPELPKK